MCIKGKCGSGVCDSKGSLKFRPRKDRGYYIRQIHRPPSEYFVVITEMKWSSGREAISSQQADHPLFMRLPLSLNLFCWNRGLIVSLRQFLFVQVTRSADFAQLACSSCKILAPSYSWTQKKVPLSGGASPYRPLQEVPPPPPPLPVLNLHTFINDADDETIACARWCLRGFIWTSSNRFMNCCQGQISTLYTIENARDEPQCLRA